MTPRWIGSLGFALLAQTTAVMAAPSPKPSCNLFTWKNVTHYETLGSMNPTVVKFLLTRFGPQGTDQSNLLAERDAPWQATDALDPEHSLPLRRFIYGLKFGSRWYIWYERGGKTYSTHLVAYNFAQDAPAPTLVAHLTPLLGDLCPVTRTLLTARLRPRGGLDSVPW